MRLPSRFPVIEEKLVTKQKFIDFWAATYVDPREHLYTPNIGKRLTQHRLLELFEWKNGGPIAKQKLESVHRNYINTQPQPPSPGDRDEHIRFIQLPGGAIWRIFWLHCHDHVTYPIFDQHVFRAMHMLLHGRAAEIPDTNLGKAATYFDEYLPFHASFRCMDPRALDKALWSYGKFLKGPFAL